MHAKTKKLGTDTSYKRPQVTAQEQLSPEQIAEKLEGYMQINNISEVPLDTHIRYFSIQNDGTKLFRLGGFLRNKINADKYVVLSNGKNSWTVQVKNSVFFKKMNHEEEIESIHQHYKQQLQEKDKIIFKLKNKLQLLSNQTIPLGSKNKKNLI
ncbi:hypothetical protein [Acanthamoeba polyphaga mimivirus]|uniref:Uncharacterized protein n=1 Tax=Acanthamoeba polyphaga mimivirus TaxID=212035 RepID=A0A0G2Y5A5_MIMIV|nr:hypothetical protein [Acanthamoeba polyphaga mimivirus]